MELLMSSLGGFLIGSLSPAYLFSKRRGFDIRNEGTGNAGATNTMFVIGVRQGVIVMLLDVFKAFSCVFAAKCLFSSAYSGIAAGLACTAGHIFPPFLRFKGGKGTACLGGLILALTPPLLPLMLAGTVILGLVIDYASILPLIAAAAYPFAYFIYTGSGSGALALGIAFPLLLWSHRGNFVAHRAGREGSFRKAVLHRELDDCAARQHAAAPELVAPDGGRDAEEEPGAE